MKICVVIPSFYPAIHYGGPIFSSLNTCKELSKISNMEINVSTTNVNMGKGRLNVLINSWVKFREKFHVKYYNISHLGFSFSLYLNLWRDIKKADIVHIQGIFNSPTPAALFYATFFRRSIILSPRGVLGSWCLEKRSILKKLWLNLFIKPFALRIMWHATGELEKAEILSLYPRAQITVISNGVSIDEFSKFESLSKTDYIQKFANCCPENVDNIIVSMGRLNKKKGFDILINAFKQFLFHHKDSYLLIAGPDETEGTKLLQLISELDLSKSVFLIGTVENQEKIDFLANADLFVLPSHNENFGNVYAESLAAGTPVVASLQTPWQHVEDYKCGKWVANNVESTCSAMLELLGNDRSIMRKNSLELSKNYDWAAVASKFKIAFNKLL
jgi:glycosyltransferase involved in cell wall biosynthesis